MQRKIPKKGYRVLAIVWTLAAAAMGVAFIRRLAEFNLFLLCMFLLSLLTASNFWKSYKRAPEADGGPDPFGAPPTFAGDPVLFDDDPPPSGGHSNKDSEENNHER